MDWDEQADIIVIGSGAAGLSAAVEASKTSCSVIVFEKMKLTGGNTRISDGSLCAPGNFLQKKLGVSDSRELFIKDITQAGLGLNHPQLVKTFAEKAAEAVEWTRDELGVKYMDRLDKFGGHSAARGVTTRSHSGVDLIKGLSVRLKQLGVAIRTQSTLTRLITDTGGSVCGVTIKTGEKSSGDAEKKIRNIKANRAVVLAAGGFGNDVEFRLLQNPLLDESIGSTNHQGADAGGLITALKIQAVPIHFSWIQLAPWGCVDEKGYGLGGRFASYSVYPCGVLIDPVTGKRIVNEWGDRKQRSDAIIGAGHFCIGIVDAKGAEMDSDSLEKCIKNGKVKGFETMEDLAGEYEMPPAQLSATINAYNQMVQNGIRDEFGKQLGQNAQRLEHPPYYAIRLWPKVHYTPGGVGITPKTQVINLNNSLIPRLYAAGEVCGGIHGASRLGGNALTECIVFGRIAGIEAASMPPRE